MPPKKRLRVVAELAELLPGSPRILIDEATAAADAGEPAAARRLLDRAAGLEPGIGDSSALASTYRALGDPERAIRILEPLASRRPELAAELAGARADAADWTSVAERRARAKDFPAAIAILERHEASLRGGDELRRAAAIYGSMNLRRPQIGLLRRAVRIAPRAPGAWIELGSAADAAGDRGLATRALETAGRLPLDAADQDQLALAYQARGELKRALALLDGLARTQPPTARWLNDRGVCRYLNGDAPGAVADLEAALRLDPDLASARMSLSAIRPARR